MDNREKREQLEKDLRSAQEPEREEIVRKLNDLAGQRGADTRPRGEESEKR